MNDPESDGVAATSEMDASRDASKSAGQKRKKAHAASGTVAAPLREYPRLKARHRAEREGYTTNLSLRVHRALSWLDGSERLAAQDERDGQFIFLWIAFNAAYATEIEDRDRPYEQAAFLRFLRKLVKLDESNGRVEGLLWKEFSGSIRVLLDNPYVYDAFWAFQKGRLTEDEWTARFAADKQTAQRALGRRNTVRVLSIVLSRIYVLRNQLVHGGATWKGGVNREQLRDCTNFMAKLVPVIVEIMMDHPHTLWGDACYPVVK
jgi:hypothetical protein